MKTKFFILFILFLSLLTGCGQDPVQEDLLNYVNVELAKTTSLENEAINAYEGVTGSNYKNDVESYAVLNNIVIPKYHEFINRIESIQPKTEEVRQIHELHISSVNKQYNALLKLMTAIENGDSDKVIEANEMLSNSRSDMRNYKARLNELGKKYDVKIDW